MVKGAETSAFDTVSLGIAACALLFTVGSFWWLYARRGRLRLVGEPRSFALSMAGGRLHLTIPLSLHNTGPTPVWATNLRICFEHPGLPHHVPFVATRPGVNPRKDDDRPLATQVVLTGRESRVLCCEFIARTTDCQLEEGEIRARLEAYETRTWGRARWRSLGDVPLRFTSDVLTKQGSYIAHDNDPGSRGA